MMAPPFLSRGVGKLLNPVRHHRSKQMLQNHTRLHLACGYNVLDGWANIEARGTGKVIGWNLTEALPISSGTIELVYSEHFIEHISREQAVALIADIYRVLKPGGILRLSTPSLRKLVDEYLAGRTTEWGEMNWNPGTPCQMLNEGLHLWGHQFVYDAQELQSILETAGFSRIIQVGWRESSTPALRNLECRPFHDEIIVEASK